MGYVIGGIVVVIAYLLCCSGGTITKDVCEDGFIHHVTYEKDFTGKPGKVVEDIPTSDPCSCVTGVNQVASGPTSGLSRLHPHQEDNCHSGDKQGNKKPLSSENAAGSTSGFGGGSPSTATGENPGPPNDPLPNFVVWTEARRLHNSAVTPGSAFTYTLPFRNLPAGPLFNGATVSAPSTCNTSLNPTLFSVYHVDNVVKRSNICTGQVLATINVPTLPLQVKVTPDASTAVVTSYGGAITFIDTATNQASGSIQFPFDPNFTPSGLAISPDGAYALVTNYEPPPESYLLVVDLANRRVAQKIGLDIEFPQCVFINPDGTLAWITFPWDNSVEVMDILTGTRVQTLTVLEPFSMVFNSTGTQAFVSSGLGSVEVIDTKTYAVITTIPADLGATDLQLSPDGAFVLVNNSSAQSVTVIETASLTATTAKIAGTPQGAVIVPIQ